jgi:hypothetical protein
LLLAAVAATAASAAAPVPSASATPAAMTPASPLQNPGKCNAFLGELALSPLDSALPLTGALCGACSDPVCQHGTINQACGRQGAGIKVCTSLLGDRCSQDNNFHCTCYFGPIP